MPSLPLDRPASREALLETLLDRVTASIVTVDREGRVSYANRMALETLGLSSGQCLGRDAVELFGEAVLGALGAGSGGERRTELSLRRPDGRPLEVGLTIVRTGAEEPSEVAQVLIFRDLGERRQMEMELRRVERLSALGRMVAGFAHEIRNPLAGIQGLTELLLSELAPADPRHEIAARIRPLLARVERFVKAALDFGEPQPPVRQPHAARDIVAAALATLGPRLGRGPGPEVTIQGDPWVEADAGHVRECLLALVENALEACGRPQGVRIDVRAEPAPAPGARGSVRFDVRDQGPGIPDAELARVFDPFYSTKPDGTGLGLALAQRLVRENRGHLLAASRPGEGALFSLVLPEASR